eukprot:16436229-Heterocapsa_arctica.AAC.1
MGRQSGGGMANQALEALVANQAGYRPFAPRPVRADSQAVEDVVVAAVAAAARSRSPGGGSRSSSSSCAAAPAIAGRRPASP